MCRAAIEWLLSLSSLRPSLVRRNLIDKAIVSVIEIDPLVIVQIVCAVLGVRDGPSNIAAEDRARFASRCGWSVIP